MRNAFAAAVVVVAATFLSFAAHADIAPDPDDPRPRPSRPAVWPPQQVPPPAEESKKSGCSHVDVVDLAPAFAALAACAFAIAVRRRAAGETLPEAT
jgi:hypothetical protein